MKHPFWIANSSLFFLTIFVLGFVYVSRVPLPERESIEPRAYVKPVKEQALKINISKIYQDDLFGTYKKEVPVPKEPVYTAPLPKPPEPQIVAVPDLPMPQFLDPLNVTLRGIIVVSSNEKKNRAIIADNITNVESVYQVGDNIEDAQLIRIFSNKIMFLRSNGQQEVLYLREDDAANDPVYRSIDGWEQVVEQIATDKYIIGMREFVIRVQNLAKFIDILGMTTAYKQGKSVGCKVGQLQEKSLGQVLGFEKGDIIVAINEISVINADDRLKAYKEVIAMKQDDTIAVKLVRANQEIIKWYTLKEFTQAGLDAQQLTPAIVHSIERQKIKEKEAIMQQKYNVAPTVDEIRKRERQNMLEKGRAPKATQATVTE